MLLSLVRVWSKGLRLSSLVCVWSKGHHAVVFGVCLV